MAKEEVSVYHNSRLLKWFPVWFYQIILPVIGAALVACAAMKYYDLYSNNSVSYEISKNREGEKFIDKIGDSGHSVNCGPPANQMDFSWSPKILHKSTNPLTLTLDMLATVDLHSGNVQLNVTHQMEADSAIFQINRSGGCHKLQKLGFKNLSCPVKANDQIKTSLKVTDLTRLPEGDFILMIVMTNENKEIFLCLKTEVTVQG